MPISSKRSRLLKVKDLWSNYREKQEEDQHKNQGGGPCRGDMQGELMGAHRGAFGFWLIPFLSWVMSVITNYVLYQYGYIYVTFHL